MDNESKEWSKKWLYYCEENIENFKPWTFDFKQCYINDELKNSKYGNSKLETELAYKNFLLTNVNPDFNITGETEKNADCDKENFHNYNVLGWQDECKSQIRGDSLNSFMTTFTPLLSVSRTPFSMQNINTWENEYNEIPNLKSQLKKWVESHSVEENISKFYFHQENISRYNNGDTQIKLLEEIIDFANLTHSIGNFGVITSWMNQGRGIGNIHDYWDLTLRDLRNFFLNIDTVIGEEIWKKFINNNYYNCFVNKDYTIANLWKGHLQSGNSPEKIEDFEQFYHNVNLLIKERGKWITKQLCDKLELQDLNFYNELKDMKKIKFFDEIDGIIK